MNISFFIGGLSGGGAERVTCNLANYFSNRGHHVSILTMSDDAPTYKLNKEIERCVLINKGERRCFVFNTVLRLFRLCKYLKKSQTEVYVVMLPVTTILLLQMKWLTRAKVVAAERSDPNQCSLKVQKALKRSAGKADGWIFQTQFQKDWYGGGIKNGVVIPNAINPDFLGPTYRGDRRKVIVAVGSLSKPKNHELLIQAFSLLNKDYPEYNLVIYGKGPKLELLQNLIIDLELEGKVVFPGYSTNIRKDIEDVTMFVLSSDFEGLPNALMEAMAIGLPCVSTDCDGGGAKFLIENEKNGLLVPKGNVEALSEAMRKMISNKEFAELCGQEAHKICERLAPERIYGEWESFIKQIATCD